MFFVFKTPPTLYQSKRFIVEIFFVCQGLRNSSKRFHALTLYMKSCTLILNKVTILKINNYEI